MKYIDLFLNHVVDLLTNVVITNYEYEFSLTIENKDIINFLNDN